MIKKIVLLIILVFIFSHRLSVAEIKILVSVDNEIITNYDIKKESNYLEILNPNFIKLDNKKKLNIAKSYLIDQIIKDKETKKFNKTNKDKKIIDDYLKNLYLDLGFNNENEFKDLLKQKKNYNLYEVKEKISKELLWNELIYLRYKDQVKIDKEKILVKINKMQTNINKEYLLSEILFTKKKDITIKNLFEEIKLSIQEIGFNNSANIFSNSDSAKYGGKIGWISEISLSEKIKEKLENKKKGEYTDFIKLGNNFLILKIEDINIKKSEINKQKEIEKLINLERNTQLNKFSKIYFNKVKLNYIINEK